MEQKYLVLTGNEYGLDLPTSPGGTAGLIELKPAMTLYKKFLDECGCAVMYELTSTGLLCIKSENRF